MMFAEDGEMMLEYAPISTYLRSMLTDAVETLPTSSEKISLVYETWE